MRVMNIFWALVLGTTQGLTEFFPVSSSAHLYLLPWMFGFPYPGLAFDIALHAGTLLAILIAFMLDWKVMAKAVFIKEKSFEKKLVLFLILTSIPGAIFGYLLEERATNVFRTPLLTATVLLIFGAILLVVDKYSRGEKELKDMTATRAFLVGLSQAIALIPGVSRSGATVTASRALGFNRETAVKYSFLAAAPIIFGATIFGLRNVSISELTSINWAFGFLASLISSYLAMKFLLKYVAKHDFKIFVWYRVILALIVLLIFLGR